MKTFAGGFDFYPEAGKTFEERTREYLERQLCLLHRRHTCAYCVLGTPPVDTHAPTVCWVLGKALGNTGTEKKIKNK